MWHVIKCIYKRTDLIARRLYGHVIYKLDDYSRALSWPLDALHSDHGLEEFVAAIPGFIARPLRPSKEAPGAFDISRRIRIAAPSTYPGPPLPTRYGSRRTSNIRQGAQPQRNLNLRARDAADLPLGAHTIEVPSRNHRLPHAVLGLVTSSTPRAR